MTVEKSKSEKKICKENSLGPHLTLYTKNKYQITWRVMNDMIWRCDKTWKYNKIQKKISFPSRNF